MQQQKYLKQKYPQQAIPKISEVLYTAIVYTLNPDAILASYDTKYI